MAALEDGGEELLEDQGLVFGEEEVAEGGLAGPLEVGQADHRQPGPIDVVEGAVEVADADEVGAVLGEGDELLPVGLEPLEVLDVGTCAEPLDDPAGLVAHGEGPAE